MLLHNPRNCSRSLICDVFKDDFDTYLNNPDISRPYQYRMVNHDQIEIVSCPAGEIIFRLLILENFVQIIQYVKDEQALAEVKSFLARRLHIAREQF